MAFLFKRKSKEEKEADQQAKIEAAKAYRDEYAKQRIVNARQHAIERARHDALPLSKKMGESMGNFVHGVKAIGAGVEALGANFGMGDFDPNHSELNIFNDGKARKKNKK